MADAMPRCEACDAGPFNAADLTPPLTPSMEPLNRGQLSSSLDLESGTLTEELVASATINGVPATVPVTVCPHARVACGFRSDGVERIEWFVYRGRVPLAGGVLFLS